MDPNYNTPNGAPSNLSGGGNPNNTKPSVSRGRNKFNFNRREFTTARYGEINPFFSFNTTPGDKVPLSSSHELRSLSLKSPLMTDLRMVKSYFDVPMDAILPRTWELIYTNPTQGDDVPDDCICLFNRERFTTLLTYLQDQVENLRNTSVSEDFNYAFRCFILLEQICSESGLLSMLGCSLKRFMYPYGSDWDPGTVDHVFSLYHDEFFKYFKDNRTRFSFVTDSFVIEDDASLSDYEFVCDLLRDNIKSGIEFIGDDLNLSNVTLLISGQGLFQPHIPENINLSRVLAYQLVCAEFMSNEFVDSIYSAKLFRDNAQTLVYLPSFSYNGVNIQHDVFSGNTISIAVYTLCIEPTTSLASRLDHLSYFSLIFGKRMSLKKTDYFTGCKTRRLAVGDINAPVVSSEVSAVDMTHAIQMQRFLNSVNKFGRKFSKYVTGLFGVQAIPDRHEPHFIASDVFSVGGFEVENTTSTDQGKQVSLLRSSNSKWSFEIECNVPSIIIGLFHFEVDRAYADTVDKFFLHVDRFDMFNPFMQYIGDQAVNICEITGNGLDEGSFGYQSRYAEYKQTFDHASGAFAAGALPSWTFVEGESEYRFPYALSLNSDYIRSHPVEFDRFYASLTGNTLASRFHFIIAFNNICTPSRPIEFNPNIL